MQLVISQQHLLVDFITRDLGRKLHIFYPKTIIYFTVGYFVFFSTVFAFDLSWATDWLSLRTKQPPCHYLLETEWNPYFLKSLTLISHEIMVTHM